MPYGSVGGMERLALTFYNHYRAIGCEVKALKIIALESDIIRFGDDQLHLSTIDFAAMSPLKRLLFYANAPRRIRGIVKKYGITHSIAFGDMANVFSSLSFTNEFKVASIHSFKSIEFRHPDFLGKLFKLAYRTSYRYFGKVVCFSNTIRVDLIENCQFGFPEKLEVIYNPHDIPQILRLADEPLEKGEEKLFDGNTILFLGRLTIPKAPWHLINAFEMLLEKMPDARLVLVGDGNPDVTDCLTSLVERKNLTSQVIFLGRRDNPYKYLKAAQVTALTSYYEGTPNVIVESIALGVPVVTSNSTGGIGELMGFGDEKFDDGVCRMPSGLITPTFFKGFVGIPKDFPPVPEERIFAEALFEVMTDSKFVKALAESRGKLLEKFDLATVAARYLKKPAL